jgi:hypothetical protein
MSSCRASWHYGRNISKNQLALIDAIHRLKYDSIDLTGDVNASSAVDPSMANSQAIIDLLGKILV